MSNSTLEIKDQAVKKMFDELQGREQKKVYKRSVSAALNIVKRKTISNLAGKLSPGAITRKDRYNNTLKKGIRTKVYKDTKSGVIHIMGNYKLKWFELGTNYRYNKKKKRGYRVGGKNVSTLLKKMRYTGSIPAYHFFKAAKQSTENQIFSNIEKIIAESIVKINKKYAERN